MPKTIAQRELRNDNATIMKAVAAGETFIVTRNGVPIAELRPIQLARPKFLSKQVFLEMAATMPHIDAKQFREDMDRSIDQSLV